MMTIEIDRNDQLCTVSHMASLIYNSTVPPKARDIHTNQIHIRIQPKISHSHIATVT